MSQSDRAAMRRDLVWGLLWALPRCEGTDLGWGRTKDVWIAWLDGRSECGCVFYGDYIAHKCIRADLRRLVDEGRVEERRIGRSHPEWRALEPVSALRVVHDESSEPGGDDALQDPDV